MPRSAWGVTSERTRGGSVRRETGLCWGGERRVAPSLVGVIGQVKPAASVHRCGCFPRSFCSWWSVVTASYFEWLLSCYWEPCPLKSQTDCQKLLCETASVRMEWPLWSGGGDHLGEKWSPGQVQSLGGGVLRAALPLCCVSPSFPQNRVPCLLLGPGRVPALYSHPPSPPVLRGLGSSCVGLSCHVSVSRTLV